MCSLGLVSWCQRLHALSARDKLSRRGRWSRALCIWAGRNVVGHVGIDGGLREKWANGLINPTKSKMDLKKTN